MTRLLRRAPALNSELPRLLLVLRRCHGRCSCCVASLCHLAADAATAELEAAKRAREAPETDLRGSQLQASIAASTIQALEATTTHLQEEITKVGSQMEDLKSKEDSERDEFISQMLEMNARIRQFPQMASIQLAGNSELSADGKQGKATDSNQSTTTDGDGTAATPPTSELQQPGRKPPRINAKFAILVDMYTRPTARRRQDRPCGAMAAAWALLHHAVVVALGRCDTGGSSGDGASTWWRREDRQGKRRQRRQEPFGDGGLERQGPAATTQTSSKGRQEEHQQPHRSIFCKLYVK